MSDQQTPEQGSQTPDQGQQQTDMAEPQAAGQEANGSQQQGGSGQQEMATPQGGVAASGQADAQTAGNEPQAGGPTSESANASQPSPSDASAPSSNSRPSSARSHTSQTGAEPGPSTGAGSSTVVGATGSTTGASPRSAGAGHEERSPVERAGSSKRPRRLKLGELDLKQAKIGFIGAGKIAESTINGLIHYAKISPKQIYVAAPSSKNLERLKALGCRVTKRNYDIFGRYDCDIVFLAFHGYVIKHAYKLGGSRPHPITTNYIPHQRHPIYILSLVSGVSLSQIKQCLLNPDSVKSYVFEMHRIMMNTAVGHGLGICAVDCEPDSKKLTAPIRQLLSSIAHLEHVPASQMDAACAIGGSGLAFSYYFINALADGAFKMGLSRQQAIRFASKTAQCAAQTMIESGKHPAELRDNVSSPSGAAIYGIHVLEKNDVASGVTAAVEAAHKRANDLATQDITQ